MKGKVLERSGRLPHLRLDSDVRQYLTRQSVTRLNELPHRGARGRMGIKE
jgi:hypothetical protein